MADDEGPPASGGKSGGLFEGPPIAGVPRPLALGGALVLGVAALVFLWRRKNKSGAGSTSTNTVITGSSSTGVDAAMLDAILKDWQQQPGGGGGSGGGSSSGSTGGGGASGGGGAGSSSGSTTFPSTPGASTPTQESGQMHGISTAQAQYLYDTGNQPYVYDQATGQYVRWSGTPVPGQTYYAGPLNWQDALKNGNVIGGTKGHPILKTAATAAKKATGAKTTVKPKAPARK